MDYILIDCNNQYIKCGIKIIMKLSRILLVLVIIVASSSFASEVVYWGDVSFSDYENRDENAPFGSALFCVNCPLVRKAREKLEVAQFSNFEISFNNIQRELEGSIATVVINRETYNSVEDSISGRPSYFSTFRIYGTLLIFEFGNNRYINSHPFVYQYTNNSESDLDNSDISRIFTDLYLTNESHNFFATLYSNASEITLVSNESKLIRVRNIYVSDKVKSDPAFLTFDNYWSAMASRQFESYLVESTGTAFVPFVESDQDLNYLVATFADGSKRIELPKEVAFNVSLYIDALGKVDTVVGNQRTLCYGVMSRLEIEGILSVLLNESLKRTTASCNNVDARKEFNDLYYFDQSIAVLMREIAVAFSGTGNDRFINESSENSRSTLRNFRSVRDEIFTK